MKKSNIILFIMGLLFINLQSCDQQEFLNLTPKDQLSSETFWEDESDVKVALNGLYDNLREWGMYGYGPGMDACTPNAYQWAWWEGKQKQIGNGSIEPGSGYYVEMRWSDCYDMIMNVNRFIKNIEGVDMETDIKNLYLAEARFLRGVAYNLLAQTYGRVPILDGKVLSISESREISQASEDKVWEKVHADYDFALQYLPKDARKQGSATQGAALGMKMRAYEYTRNYEQVLNMVEEIQSLNKYSLFHSYDGLFEVQNENNSEVLFDVQFAAGQKSQGSIFDRYFQPMNVEHGINGSNSVAPIQNLVDAYETIDGSPVDPENPYENRDPRLDFTILRPGAYFQGQLFPEEIQTHTGQEVGFSYRKYTIEEMEVVPWQSPLNYMVVRYAEVLLAKAEALIELNQDIDEAINIINRIRTERDDVNMYELSTGLSQEEAREKLRHERRIEFALEGVYWKDIKRWNIGSEIYPVEVKSPDGKLIETKFPEGYDETDNLLPIPDSEIALNPNLEQNPGY